MEPVADPNVSSYQQDSSQEDLIKVYQKPDAPAFILTLASPGTGKTTTIARIIQAMTQDPSNENFNFLTLTFTKKTRKDLIHKLNSFSNSNYDRRQLLVRVKNFHSLAFSLLKWSQIIDQKEVDTHMTEIIKQTKIVNAYKADQLKKQVMRVANLMLGQGSSIQEWHKTVDRKLAVPKTQPVGLVLKKYLEWLEESFEQKGAITYDYSLVKATQAIDEGAQLPSIKLDSLRLVIVDEFQDTNPAQMKMVEAILRRSKQAKLLMVGDFDQNIYEWRGTDLSYLSDYVRQHKPEIRYLQYSYRMGHSVTELSQKLIRSSPFYTQFRNRFYRNYTLQSRNPVDVMPEVRAFHSEVSEVRWVVDQIEHLMGKGVELRDMAILLRWFANNSFYQRLQIEISRRKLLGGHPAIQYDIKFHSKCLNSATFKYLMAVIGYFVIKRTNVHPQVLESYILRVTAPIRHIGKKDEALLRMLQMEEINEEHVRYQQMSDAGGRRKEAWKMFFVDFKKIRQVLTNQTEIGFERVVSKIASILTSPVWGDIGLKPNIVEQLKLIIKEIVGPQDERPSSAPLDFGHIANVYKQLFFLSNSEGSQQFDSDEGQDRPKPNQLQIQSIHDAKGLEYKAVFICSLNYAFVHFKPKPNQFRDEASDGFDKSSQFDQASKEVEQLRVIYTALTRTSHYCYVSCSRRDCVIPWWVIKNRQDHAQFTFIKQNAKNIGVVPFDETVDSDVKQHYELQLLNQGMGSMSL